MDPARLCVKEEKKRQTTKGEGKVSNMRPRRLSHVKAKRFSYLPKQKKALPAYPQSSHHIKFEASSSVIDPSSDSGFHIPIISSVVVVGLRSFRFSQSSCSKCSKAPFPYSEKCPHPSIIRQTSSNHHPIFLGQLFASGGTPSSSPHLHKTTRSLPAVQCGTGFVAPHATPGMLFGYHHLTRLSHNPHLHPCIGGALCLEQ